MLGSFGNRERLPLPIRDVRCKEIIQRHHDCITFLSQQGSYCGFSRAAAAIQYNEHRSLTVRCTTCNLNQDRLGGVNQTVRRLCHCVPFHQQVREAAACSWPVRLREGLGLRNGRDRNLQPRNFYWKLCALTRRRMGWEPSKPLLVHSREVVFVR